MTKKIFLIFTLIFLSISIKAQTYFGFKVGANLANFSGDVENNSIKPSFHVGGVAEITLTDKFSVQPEILFSIQGYQDKNDSNLKYNYYYVNVPVMVKYYINDYFTVDAGPQIGMLTYAKSSTGTEELTNLKDTSNAFDYGINLGTSYEMDNGMNVNIRYYYGLANIFKDSNLKANNTVIQISLGYKFY